MVHRPVHYVTASPTLDPDAVFDDDNGGYYNGNADDQGSLIEIPSKGSQWGSPIGILSKDSKQGS